MFRTNDPFWSRQATCEGLMGQDTGRGGEGVGNEVGLVRAWPSQVPRSDYS
jgi:hypothetical protein